MEDPCFGEDGKKLVAQRTRGKKDNYHDSTLVNHTAEKAFKG